MNVTKYTQDNQSKKLLKVSLLGLVSIPVGIVLFFIIAFTAGEIIAWIDMFNNRFAHTISFLITICVITLYLYIIISMVGFVVFLLIAIVNTVKIIVQKIIGKKVSEKILHSYKTLDKP